MFTGIINGQGKVLAVESRGHETRFRIQALYDLADIILGESIAVNGTCLTVETSGPGAFFPPMRPLKPCSARLSAC